MDRVKWVCSGCGSENVQVKMWVNPNTQEVVDAVSDGDIADNWCDDCHQHTLLELVDIKKKKTKKA